MTSSLVGSEMCIRDRTEEAKASFLVKVFPNRTLPEDAIRRDHGTGLEELFPREAENKALLYMLLTDSLSLSLRSIS
eukprot:12921178-Prorocentrum_lima.AAC.1